MPRIATNASCNPSCNTSGHTPASELGNASRGFTILECVMALIVGALITAAAFTISSRYAPSVTEATRRSFISNDLHYTINLFEARFRYDERTQTPASPYTLDTFRQSLLKPKKTTGMMSDSDRASYNEFSDIPILWKKDNTAAFTLGFCTLSLSSEDALVCAEGGGSYTASGSNATVALRITITPEEYPEMELVTYVARTRL